MARRLPAPCSRPARARADAGSCRARTTSRCWRHPPRSSVPRKSASVLDVGLNKQMIEAVVAARDDHRIGLGGLDHARRPDRRRHGRSGSGPAARPLRCSAELGAGRRSTARPRFSNNPVGLRGEQRQRLRARKHHDGELDQPVAGQMIAYGHFTTGGIEDRIESTLPPVRSPKIVPRSYSRLNST